MLKYFNDKLIWITGASSGIGAELAIQLNALGAKVIVSARRVEKLIEMKAKCKYQESIILLPLDLTDEKSIDNAVSEVKNLGPLFLIVHNAGIAQKGLVINNTMDVDRKVMETNYFGTVSLTKAVLKIFIEQGSGWIGVVTSIAGRVGVPGRSAYAASKHAFMDFLIH